MTTSVPSPLPRPTRGTARLALVLALGLSSAAPAAACDPVMLHRLAFGPDLCWGDQTWSEVTLGGAELSQVFDYYPSARSRHAPLIVWFHPDGERHHVDKGSVIDVALLRPALEAGYAFASVEFRHPVIDDYVWNTPNDPRVPHWDVSRATQFLRANAEALGFDRHQVFFVGQSRGALSLWTAEQPDLADPGSPDPVARQSSRALAAWEYQAQTTYRVQEYTTMFLVPRDRLSVDIVWTTLHPKSPEFGSTIDSVAADAPPVVLRYQDGYVDHLVTTQEMRADYDPIHYPDFGPPLCEAYATVGAPAPCRVTFDVPEAHAFDGVLAFFDAVRRRAALH
jgi:acetyl esterase/lipase